MGGTSNPNGMNDMDAWIVLNAWRAIEQLAVNSTGDTNYVIGYDMFDGVAILEEHEQRQVRDSFVVPVDAMDFIARWWLEKRGWRVFASPAAPQSAPLPVSQPETSSATRQESNQGKAQSKARR